jgi:hypothetical protein
MTLNLRLTLRPSIYYSRCDPMVLPIQPLLPAGAVGVHGKGDHLPGGAVPSDGIGTAPVPLLLLPLGQEDHSADKPPNASMPSLEIAPLLTAADVHPPCLLLRTVSDASVGSSSGGTAPPHHRDLTLSCVTHNGYTSRSSDLHTEAPFALPECLAQQPLATATLVPRLAIASLQLPSINWRPHTAPIPPSDGQL